MWCCCYRCTHPATPGVVGCGGGQRGVQREEGVGLVGREGNRQPVYEQQTDEWPLVLEAPSLHPSISPSLHPVTPGGKLAVILQRGRQSSDYDQQLYSFVSNTYKNKSAVSLPSVHPSLHPSILASLPRSSQNSSSSTWRSHNETPL